MNDRDPGELRASWEQVAPGWGRQAEAVRRWGMPVSVWMIEQVAPQAGERVLELAAGAGDTGFLALELAAPGGTLICSDGAEAMLKVAQERARALGVSGVEFRRLELEWIDLPTADVDIVLCRWGLMLTLDPEASLRECRRVLRPRGRIALSVWDEAQANPWATIPLRALGELGVGPAASGAPPTGDGPGMFALASPERLRDLLEGAGFTQVTTDAVELARAFGGVEEYLDETRELSLAAAQALAALEDEAHERLLARMAELLAPFTSGGGEIRLPGRALVAAAEA